MPRAIEISLDRKKRIHLVTNFITTIVMKLGHYSFFECNKVKDNSIGKKTE